MPVVAADELRYSVQVSSRWPQFEAGRGYANMLLVGRLMKSKLLHGIRGHAGMQCHPFLGCNVGTLTSRAEADEAWFLA